MKFHGITEATFPSIMRRSLVILCKGRFVSAARFARLPPGAQGYFLMQEDMKDFVTSKARCGCFVHDSHGRPHPIQCGQIPRKDIVARGWRWRRRPYEGHHALSLRTGARTAHPRSNGGPVHAPGTPGLGVGAADQEVDSVGSRRVPFVVQSEQDKMLRGFEPCSAPVNLCSRLGSSQRRWQITSYNGDMKANPRYPGVPNASALSASKE